MRTLSLARHISGLRISLLTSPKAQTHNRAQGRAHERAHVQRSGRKLVAEAGRNRDLVAALGAAAVQYGLSGLGGHADEKAVDLRAAAAVGLKGALGHGDLSCLRNYNLNSESWKIGKLYVCCMALRSSYESSASASPSPLWPYASFMLTAAACDRQVLSIPELRKSGNEIHSTASAKTKLCCPATQPRQFFHYLWCNRKILSKFTTFVLLETPSLRATIDSVP